MLHVLFFFGVIFGFVGIIAVLSLKVATLALSWTAWGITFVAAIIAIFLFFKCPWEVYWLNQSIDKQREFNKEALANHYKTVLEKAKAEVVKEADF